MKAAGLGLIGAWMVSDLNFHLAHIKCRSNTHPINRKADATALFAILRLFPIEDVLDMAQGGGVPGVMYVVHVDAESGG